VVKPERRIHMVETAVYGKITLRIFRKWDVGAWTGSIWLRIRKVGWILCMH
jgi:hypothetical protein